MHHLVHLCASCLIDSDSEHAQRLLGNQEGRQARQDPPMPAVVVIRGTPADMNGARTTTNHRYGHARDKERDDDDDDDGSRANGEAKLATAAARPPINGRGRGKR